MNSAPSADASLVVSYLTLRKMVGALGMLFPVVLSVGCWVFGVPPTNEKRKRNQVYVACGVAILVWIALIAAYDIFLTRTSVAEGKPVFWLESLALWSFGVSWTVKGEAILKDRP